MKCPVCRTNVAPTRNQQVQAHYDRAGAVCPASGQPIHITSEGLPR